MGTVYFHIHDGMKRLGNNFTFITFTELRFKALYILLQKHNFLGNRVVSGEGRILLRCHIEQTDQRGHAYLSRSLITRCSVQAICTGPNPACLLSGAAQGQPHQLFYNLSILRRPT